MSRYKVGRTIRTSNEFPEGVPCIVYDGDSVLCEFPSYTYGMEQAKSVANVLNMLGELDPKTLAPV